MIVPEKWVSEFRLAGMKPYRRKRPVLVRNFGDIDPALIDFLYSEVIVLNLN